ncbi:MAG: PDZ domain-containing protein [Pirellulales bacterium]
MTATVRNSALSALLALTLAAVAHATHPQALLHPGHGPLPTFGFNSYNVSGYGEVLTHVRYNSIAGRMGLEPGDAILRLNNYRLDYHGAWRNALRQAVYNGGFVRLAIRDVHTGQIAYRQTYLPGCNVGPVTPKSHIVGHGGNYYDEHVGHGHGYPGPIVGPITQKSKPQFGNGGNVKFKNFDNIKKLVHKFEKND